MELVKKYADDGGDQAANWLRDARNNIDDKFGEGYAAANPQLLAAMVQAAALNFHATWLGKALDDHSLFSGD